MFKYGGPIKEGIMHGMSNGGRIGFADGPKKKTYDWFETPVGSIFDPKGIKTGFQKMGAGIYDLTGVPANIATRMLTGYNPGFSGAKFMGIEPDKPDTSYWMGIPTSTKKGWTIPSMQEGPTAAEIELARLKEELAKKKVATTSRWDRTAPDLTESQRTKLAKDQQNKRLKSYLDMMGYDSAKKGALSKALIDASAIVQQGTEEAGSLKESDWGKMINKAIQATSKRLEKPEQIREAVGLMSVKAAIEKDMRGEEDALKTKALKLNIEKAQKDLKGLSIGELIPSISKGLGKTRVDAEVMKNVMSVKEPDIIAKIVGKKDDLADIKDLKDFTTVEDFIVKKYKGKEGIYIIDNVVVQIYADGTSKQLY